MDFTPDPTQQAVLDAVATVLERGAGPERARSITGIDGELTAALRHGGYLDLAVEEQAGPLTAALVVEAVSLANGQIPIGARALVAPALLGPGAPDHIALARADVDAPVRFGDGADLVLVLDGDGVRAVEPASVTPIKSPFGQAYGRLDLSGGRELGDGSADALHRWWQVAIAAEMVGAMQGALDHTVAHLSQRVQFDRPIGSLQGVQHRLAEAHVWVEGARWLTRAAAWGGARRDLAAAAAGHAAEAARIIGTDMHQLSGAIGFTLEFDLHLWTTRLHALRLELGGASAHYRALANATWG
jgi:alkylation response protein AidB-like acyl-CoA dehydrogenase